MGSPVKIVFAEDELALGQIVSETLSMKGFEVIYCQDGIEAWDAYLKERPQLLVLDVMMPKKDGFQLAKEIRKQDQTTPILFLTAKSQPKDVVEGFTIGGNDYLKKPFSIEELIVRINNLLDRVAPGRMSEITLGGYTFQPKKQKLLFDQDEEILLTHRESELLFHLSINKNHVLDRSLILKKLWNNDDFFSARSMDVFISKLRKKLSKDPAVSIVNIRGYGYKLICE